MFLSAAAGLPEGADAVRIVDHHDRVLREGCVVYARQHHDAIERRVVDLETSVRGFAITGQPRYLEPWAAARAALPQELSQLAALADTPGGCGWGAAPPWHASLEHADGVLTGKPPSTRAS